MQIEGPKQVAKHTSVDIWIAWYHANYDYIYISEEAKKVFFFVSKEGVKITVEHVFMKI